MGLFLNKTTLVRPFFFLLFYPLYLPLHFIFPFSTATCRQRKRTRHEQSSKREKQRSGSRRVSGNRPSTRARLPQTEPKSSTLGLSGEDSSDQRWKWRVPTSLGFRRDL
uniref:Uncharacterized protein n=1 Tax=Helianthus annuus TaxID=4232 RepID=A0A251UNV2_HELAN